MFSCITLRKYFLSSFLFFCFQDGILQDVVANAFKERTVLTIAVRHLYNKCTKVYRDLLVKGGRGIDLPEILHR